MMVKKKIISTSSLIARDAQLHGSPIGLRLLCLEAGAHKRATLPCVCLFLQDTWELIARFSFASFLWSAQAAEFACWFPHGMESEPHMVRFQYGHDPWGCIL